MTGRERFLCALNNEKPDHLPCQVHAWMPYYLNHYLNGMDQFEAYDFFGMDPVIYCGPNYIYDERDLANWQVDTVDTGTDDQGYHHYVRTITTPGGVLTEKLAENAFTPWTTEYAIKDEQTFEIWNKYVPVPVKVDWTPVIECKRRIGDRGIVRGGCYSFGQGSPWQSFVFNYDTQQAIMDCFDKPDWIHHCLDEILKKTLRVLDLWGKCELDLVETGGGAGSSTVLSPKLHREFCLPYDRKTHDALHAAGTKTVYHLCGGFMPLLETVVENGTDGLETMSPVNMGGDCRMAEATERVGDKLFFVGGFDQNAGFEHGTVENIRQQVAELHAACPNGGYICSPSDHFFFGEHECIRAFVQACREATY